MAASYLISSDYLPSVQTGDLTGMTQNNIASQHLAEQAAQAEVISHLRQKYDTTKEFTPTAPWNPSGVSLANYPTRTALTAAAWVANTSYTVGQFVEWTDSNIYQCILLNNDATFISAHWINLGATGSIPYQANDRIYLSAQGYSSGITYALNALVIYNAPWVASTSYTLNQQILYTDGNIYMCAIANSDTTFTPAKWRQVGPQSYIGAVYVCTTAIVAPEAFNPAHWTLAGQCNSIFYGALPPNVTAFDYSNGYYVTGNQVYYKGLVYSCIIGTRYPDHTEELQVETTTGVIAGNVFPDDPSNGSKCWGIGIPYYIPKGTPITNTLYWTAGDNRDVDLVSRMVDITAYRLSKNIAPKNIPDKLIFAYMGADNDKTHFTGKMFYPLYSALGWLQGCARGEITPNLPLLQPTQGSRIRFSSKPRQINNY